MAFVKRNDELFKNPTTLTKTHNVIPACPESFFKKDSGLPNVFGIAGMTNDCYLYTVSY